MAAARFARSVFHGSRSRLGGGQPEAVLGHRSPAQEAATLEERGFDVSEGGFDNSKSGAQKVEFAATTKQVAELEKGRHRGPRR